MDAKEALQYVYCVCLNSDQGNDVGKEQLENAWELVRRIIVLANTGPAWEELVGGFRPDGTRFVSILRPQMFTYAHPLIPERCHRARR
jgi:nuclear pore complex protein Nup93